MRKVIIDQQDSGNNSDNNYSQSTSMEQTTSESSDSSSVIPILDSRLRSQISTNLVQMRQLKQNPLPEGDGEEKGDPKSISARFIDGCNVTRLRVPSNLPKMTNKCVKAYLDEL